MAEGVFLHILKRERREKDFTVDSAGTIGYHAGELPDSRMRMHAAKRGFEYVIDLLEDACENLFSQLISISSHHHIITSKK